MNPRPPPYQDSPSEVLKNFERFCGVDLQLAERTVRDHRSKIGRILEYLQKDFWEVSKEDLRGYLLVFKQSHATATYAGVLKSLKVFFRDFLDSPELVSSFKFPQIPFKPKMVPSKDDLQKFYEALDSEIGEALFLFFASSGLRKSEVLSLTLDEVDFNKRMVIPKGHNGSTKNSYVSFYNRETERALNKLKLGGDKLFSVSDRQFRKIWITASKQTGLTVSPQRLREWFCCEMGNLGVSDRYIDAFCGRIQKSVLARYYTDYNPERLKRIYDGANLKVLA